MNELSFLCCSVLRNELEHFLPARYPGAEMVFLDSMLHMRPRELEKELNQWLERKAGRQCVLIYGDCHAHMREDARRPGCVRTTGANCGELLLGREEYRRLRNERTFLFLPEWTTRWREVFENQLGFVDRELAREFMAETRKRLVYLDTGLEPPPLSTLADIEEFFAMEVEVLPVSLDHLAQAIATAVRRLSVETP